MPSRTRFSFFAMLAASPNSPIVAVNQSDSDHELSLWLNPFGLSHLARFSPLKVSIFIFLSRRPFRFVYQNIADLDAQRRTDLLQRIDTRHRFPVDRRPDT